MEVYFYCSPQYLATNCEETYAIRGPFYWHSLILILGGIINYIHYEVRDEITSLFANFQQLYCRGLGWMSNYILLFYVCVIA